MSKNTQQKTLFGGTVAEDEPKKDLAFVTVHEEVVNDGDQFTMHPTTATYNETKHCLTLVDTEKAQALTVWFENHPNARYKSVPNGVRLGNAVAKCLEVEICEYDDLAACFIDNALEVNITHTGEKGRLWTVSKVE